MQVLGINTINNMSCNQNFGAKFSIKGDIEQIPEKAIRKWTRIAESVGNMKDEILINVLAESNECEHFNSDYMCSTKHSYSRNIAVATSFDNKLNADIIQAYRNFNVFATSNDTGTDSKDKTKERLGRTIDSITAYLSSLKK